MPLTHQAATLLSPSGNQYVGDVVEGANIGVFRCDKNGVVYEGEFNRESTKMDGAGVTTWPAGDKHEGLSRNGEMEGYGQGFFANGDIYRGEYRESKFHGYGELLYADGTKYRGQFMHGKQCGYGEMALSVSGDVYRGEFGEDVYSGLGELTVLDGMVAYRGEWRRGKMHGRCRVTRISGRVEEMIWAHGVDTRRACNTADLMAKIDEGE